MPQAEWKKGDRGKTPDGTLVEWDGTGFLPVDVSKEAGPPKTTWADKLNLNTPSNSPMEGFVKGSTSAAVDMAEGLKAGAAKTVFEGGDLIRRATGMERVIDRPEVQAGMTRPDTVAGAVGEYAPAVAGAAKLAVSGINALPSAARAAGKFKDVMAVAKDLPVSVGQTGAVAQRLAELAERGGQMPKVARNFIQRISDTSKGPLRYEEARDFASVASRLSADEMGRLAPVVKYELANMRVALNEAIVRTAQTVGKGKEYMEAMAEYHKAMKLREFAKKAIPIAAAGGALAYAERKIRGMMP